MFPRGGQSAQGSGADWDVKRPVAFTSPQLMPARTPGEVGVTNSRGKHIDVHEVMKREAFKSPNAASDNHFEKNRPSPDAPYGVSDQYLVLDSFDQVPTSRNDQGTYEYNFNVQGSWTPQAIGVKDKIETVIAIQVGPFSVPPFAALPYVLNPAGAGNNAGLPVLTPNAGAPSTDPLASPLTQVPFGNRVTLELEQLNTQSFRDRFNAHHHFEFTASPDVFLSPAGVVSRGTLLLTPERDWDTYVFTDPIKDLQGVKLQFRNPDQPVAFPLSCLYGASASVSAAAQVLQMNYAAHGLAAGDRVYVQNFYTGNSILDRYVGLVSGYGNKNGLIVGAAGLTADSFRFNPDIGVAPLGYALGANIPRPTAVFSIPWATGPSTATTCAALYGFAVADVNGQSSYTGTTAVANPGPYVVAGGVNDGFDFVVDALTKSVALTPGSYTPSQLAVLLEQAMNSVSFGFSVAYTAKTGLFTISRQAFPPLGQLTVCVAKNRVRVPLRVRTVVARLTNYIAP